MCRVVSAPSLVLATLLAAAGPTLRAADPPKINHHDLTFFVDDAGHQQPIRTIADWEKRKAEVLLGLQAVMGDLPADDRRVPLTVEILSEETKDGITFKKLTYQSEPGTRVPAWLLIPSERQKPAPAMLSLHQTTQLGKDEPAGFGGSENLHYALELAQRGYVTLAPDFPTLGEYQWKLEEHPDYAGGTMQAIWNHIRAVDLLESLPEVDKDRIGVIGHSLGGHNAMFLGAFDPRVKVIVSSCGFTRFHKDDMPSWTGERYMPRIATVYNNDADQVPFDFAEIVGTFAPHAFFASAATGDDDFDVTGVKDVMDSAAFVYKLYGAEPKLAATYPESPHDFPPAARRRAYAFIDEQLK